MYRTVAVEKLPVELKQTAVDTPLKVHLHDGSVVLLREGATFQGGQIRGAAVRYTFTLADSARIDSVSIQSVSANGGRYPYDGKLFTQVIAYHCIGDCVRETHTFDTRLEDDGIWHKSGTIRDTIELEELWRWID